MKAIDVMTHRVISVNPETPVRQIAMLLFEHRISGVPVVEKGRLVGMISEADLLHRHEIGTDRIGQGAAWWRRLFALDSAMEDYIRSHAVRARDLMSRKVVSVEEDTPLADIATLLETRGIKRVPVLRRGKLVGIVSRSNLVGALAGARPQAATEWTDAGIRRRLLDELNRQSWWEDASSNVVVDDGVVHYSGLIHSDQERKAARVAAEGLAGVRRVEDHRMFWRQLPESL